MTKSGEKAYVIKCRTCGHVQNVFAVPGDLGGNPKSTFQMICTNQKCKADLEYQLSDIVVGVCQTIQ